MATPGERKALIFFASVAALGVTVRGWQQLHPQNPGPIASGRGALARQIEAVDSAIAVTNAKRKRTASAPRIDTIVSEPKPRAVRVKGHPAPSDSAPTGRALYRQRIARLDSMRVAAEGAPKVKSGRAESLRRPSLRESVPVDLDTAPLDSIAALPSVGPAIARRIVSDRSERGPFGTLDGLLRIQGFTSAYVRRLSPYVTFSRVPRLGSEAVKGRSKSGRQSGVMLRP